jgi:hypothetical protein
MQATALADDLVNPGLSSLKTQLRHASVAIK